MKKDRPPSHTETSGVPSPNAKTTVAKATSRARHVKSQHKSYLDQRHPQLINTLEDLGHSVCCRCSSITGGDIGGLCLVCFKNDSAEIGKVRDDTDAPKRIECTQRIRKTNSTRLTVLTDIPRSLLHSTPKGQTQNRVPSFGSRRAVVQDEGHDCEARPSRKKPEEITHPLLEETDDTLASRRSRRSVGDSGET